MIRAFNEKDMNRVLEIWLETSIQSHNFIGKEFWESKVNDMKTIYIPSSKTIVYEKNNDILAFYCMKENVLTAIFVLPKYQNRGIGKELINHAKRNNKFLTLSVYKKNSNSFKFYLSQGFKILNEQIDKDTGLKEYIMQYYS